MRDTRGFALTELLVALVLVGLISMLIVTGVSTGRRVWERADAAATAGETVEAAHATLRHRLEHAFPATRFDASAPYSDFLGSAKTMSFLGPDGDARRPGALRRYVVELTLAGELALTSTSDLSDPDAGPHERQVLLRGVGSIDLAYFGASAPDNVPRWRFGWRKQAGLPQLVRVRVQFADGDRRWWPELIVHPAATIDSLCVLDTASHRCRGRA
jgi:general secretion pathway protein J